MLTPWADSPIPMYLQTQMREDKLKNKASDTQWNCIKPYIMLLISAKFCGQKRVQGLSSIV